MSVSCFVPLRVDRPLLRQVWSALPRGMVAGKVRPVIWRRSYASRVSVRVVEVECLPFQLSLPFEGAVSFPAGFVGGESSCGCASAGVNQAQLTPAASPVAGFSNLGEIKKASAK